MSEENCYICNTITGDKYQVRNGEQYFVCSEKCLDILLEMKSLLYFIGRICGKYGRLINDKEISYLFDGWSKPKRTKLIINELINKGFLVKREKGFVELIQ